MSENIIANIVGIIFIIGGAIEIFTGKSFDKGKIIERKEKPIYYWFSVTIKIGIGLAILSYDYLRAKYGA